jgi:hypothetical protein
MDLNEKIRCYLNTKEAGRKETVLLRNDIEREIIKLCYFLPQKFSFLKEEDASEFTLHIYSQIDYIISNYKPEKGSFSNYMKSYLENRAKQFYYRKSKQIRKEKAVLRHHMYYEEMLENDEKQSRIYDPPDYARLPDTWRRKLSYAFMHSSTIHRRFFITALTFMPFMGRNTVREICRIFRFDFRETALLCEYFRKKCQDQILEEERLESRCNFYWNKVLELEYESAASRDYSLYEDSEIQFLRQLNRLHHRNRLNDIDRHTTRVPYKELSEELHVSIRYIETAVFQTRSLIQWVTGESEHFYGSNRIEWQLSEGRWKANLRYDQVPILVPSKVFETRLFTRRSK